MKSLMTVIGVTAVLSVSALAMAASVQKIEGRDSPAYPHFNGEADWASGWLKGECPMFQYQGEDGQYFLSGAFTGLSGNYYDRMAVHGLKCDGGPNVGFFDPGSLPPLAPTTWTNGDVGPWMGDWDPYYPKANCPGNSWVGGIAWHSAYGTSQIQCYRSSETYHREDSACYARIFGVNMPAPWDGGPYPGSNNGDAPRLPASGDWDVGYQKGTCELGGAVAGVSHNRLDVDPQYGGGIHGILCCPIDSDW